ncbi:MAG TPA: AAA family ATPase, partial [Leptospiraceae bacterium]|nr:AAA family ATPase [Leptospiraceae bacterium]
MAAPSANRADQISLDELVDRIEVKADIQAILNLVAIRKQKLAAGHAAPELSLHLIMIGNPGTGKTLIADILARMYRERSVLSKGHIVQITEKEAGADPVELLTRAQGGILMIDEAHRLLAGSGNILVERIVREMEKGLQDTV